MKYLKPFLFYLTIILSTCVIAVSLLSLIHDLKYWYFKILDFPRFQYLILAVFCLILFLIFNKKWKAPAVLLVIGLIVSLVIQARVILPYYFGEHPVPEAEVEIVSAKNTVRILIANVLLTNRDSEKFLEIVQNNEPDLILAMEVNEWWIQQLQVLKNEYPFVMEYPLDNAYGMSLHSKLPFKSSTIKFLNKEDVPSFHAEILMESGKSFLFVGVHPVAPVPSGKYPDNVGEKEVELIKVGNLIAQQKLPAIVAGDYNDVSWSHTSRLFESSGDLRNVRIGRGLLNSFDAKSVVLRWPLDHFFVTPEFSLISLEKLPKFGSDHFPLLAEFVLPN